MGKVAVKEPVAQMMKREAMRRPSKEASPPPEPQLGKDMLMGRTTVEEQGRITVVIIRQGWGQRNREGPHDVQVPFKQDLLFLITPSSPIIPTPTIPPKPGGLGF
jgi:hypothetical protein